MREIIIIAQNVDQNDDHRGFFVDWIREFSRNFDQVAVITLARGTFDLPSNVRVYSLGKERGVSKFIQAARFYRFLAHLLPGATGIFAHASPIFVLAAWPLAFLGRKKLVLWYLHRKTTLKLRLALGLCDAVVTADAASLTIQSSKIIAVGHGIPTQRFWVAQRIGPAGRALRILSVGRLTPIKDFVTLIFAVSSLQTQGRALEVRIVGRAVLAADQIYAQELKNLVASLGLAEVINFMGFVAYAEMPGQYAWADVVVGCTPLGGIDKVLLEAMAAGCGVLTSNAVMRPYLEPYADQLLFTPRDYDVLAARLVSLHDWPALSAAMVASVRRHHDLAATITKISQLL